MELLIKLAALSLCVSAVAALLRKNDDALALLLLLAAVLVGCAMLLPALSDLFDFCERALTLTDLPLTLFVPVVKSRPSRSWRAFPVRCARTRGRARCRACSPRRGLCARLSARCR